MGASLPFFFFASQFVASNLRSQIAVILEMDGLGKSAPNKEEKQGHRARTHACLLRAENPSGLHWGAKLLPPQQGCEGSSSVHGTALGKDSERICLLLWVWEACSARPLLTRLGQGGKAARGACRGAHRRCSRAQKARGSWSQHSPASKPMLTNTRMMGKNALSLPEKQTIPRILHPGKKKLLPPGSLLQGHEDTSPP